MNQGPHLQSSQQLKTPFTTWDPAHLFTAALASHGSGTKHPQTPKFLFSKGWRRNSSENRMQTLDFLPRKTCLCSSVTAIMSKWITCPFSKVKRYLEKSTYRSMYVLLRGNTLKTSPFPHGLPLHSSHGTSVGRDGHLEMGQRKSFYWTRWG